MSVYILPFLSFRCRLSNFCSPDASHGHQRLVNTKTNSALFFLMLSLFLSCIVEISLIYLLLMQTSLITGIANTQSILSSASSSLVNVIYQSVLILLAIILCIFIPQLRQVGKYIVSEVKSSKQKRRTSLKTRNGLQPKEYQEAIPDKPAESKTFFIVLFLLSVFLKVKYL